MTPINEAVFKQLLEGAPYPAEKARLLSVSGLRASSWLSVMPGPCVGLGLWLKPGDFRAAVQLRLGLPLGPNGVRCAFHGCGELLDKEGHHALTCKQGGDVRRRRCGDAGRRRRAYR